MIDWLRRKSARIAEQRRRQILQALTGYPPYEPPKWDPSAKSFPDADVEYSAFFHANRPRRLETLTAFLGSFDVALNLNDAGIMAVSAWFPSWADLLVENLMSEDVWAAYHEFAAPWTDPLLGLNPIFDLGVYFGECLMSRKSRLRWQPLRGPEPHNVSHCIWGLRGGRPFDPIYSMYIECRNIRSQKIPLVMRGALAPDTLYRKIIGHLL